MTQVLLRSIDAHWSWLPIAIEFLVWNQVFCAISMLSFQSLHEIRMNICCRYNSHYDYSFHILDETMENVNMWMKGLPLSPSIESWQFHSPNIVLAKRCDNYVKINNKRGKVDTENSTVESGLGEARLSALKEKKTVVPSYCCS